MDMIAAVANRVRSAGLVVTDPVRLRSTNNVVVWLAPSPVVAKISMRHEKAVRELEVARALVELDAPVIPPIAFGVEQPLRIGNATVTFWEYEPQVNVAELVPRQIASSLSRLHDKLAMLEDRFVLPSFEEPLNAAVRSLEQEGFAPELAAHDRLLLRSALIEGMSQLARADSDVLHGSPHRMNIVSRGAVASFIDLETVAIGPLEWDLAHLEHEVADVYPSWAIDPEMLDVCRVLVSAATSTWCWEGRDRGPDMRQHAEHHLEAVRSASLVGE